MTHMFAARIAATIIAVLLGTGLSSAFADDMRQDLRQDLRLDLRQDLRTPPQQMQMTGRKDKGAAAQNQRRSAKQSADQDILEDPQSIKDAKRGFH